MDSAAISARSIDDFLDQIYYKYSRRLPNSSVDVGVTSATHGGWRFIGEKIKSGIRLLLCTPRSIISRYGCCTHSIREYRHYLPLPLLALCIANSSDATEILMLSYLLADPTFRKDMLDNSDSDASMESAEYLAASIFMGMLLGGILLGFLSDHIGRRPSLLTGLFINATAGLLSSIPFLTPTCRQLTIWRFLAGLGIGATIPSIFSLASEWAPKAVRGSVVTAVASFWMVGSLFVSGLAWILFRINDEDGSQNDERQSLAMWRIFTFFCATPSAFGALMVYLYLPESPRFLASSKKDYEQSANSCNQMAGFLGIQVINNASEGDKALMKEKDRNTRNTSMDSASFDTISPITARELRRDYSSFQNLDNRINYYTMSILINRIPRVLYKPVETLQKVYSPQLFFHTTAPLQILWFSLSFGTYGITTWINTLFVENNLQNIYFNSFLFALANLPGNFMSILYSDKWGRKRMLVGSLIGAAGGLLGFAILAYTGGDVLSVNIHTYGIVMFACTFQMFSIVSWNSIDVLTGELFPTNVRSAGMGICAASGRFGAMSAQFINARLMMSNGDKGAQASVWVLVVAASVLLLGTGIPMFLDKDMTLGELKDEIVEERPNRIVNEDHKDHIGDEEFQSLF